MANVDTSIYGNVRQFSMPDPIEQAGRAMQLQANSLQIQDAQRKFTLEDDISSALSESGGDLSKASTLLAARGRGTAALTLGDKATAKRKADIEEKLKLAEAMGSDAITLDSAYRSALARLGGDQAAAIAEVTPTYQQVRSKWAQLGQALPEQFDPVGNFAGIGQAKELTAYLKTLAPDIAMTDIGGSVVPTNRNPLAGPVGPLAGAKPMEKTPAPKAPEPTELARYQAERAAMQPGDPRIPQHDRVIANFKAGRGGVEINSPLVAGPMTPTKPTANKIDEDLLKATRNLMQLDVISTQFRPEFQRFQDKVGFAALKLKDSTTGLTNKEKSDLGAYSTYRRNAFTSLNEYIQSVTGAAMSEQEAKRIRKAMPDPGDGLFDGDSPTEFAAKMASATKQAKMAVARLSYMKRRGMSLGDGKGEFPIPLDSMPKLMNDRGREIEEELKAAGTQEAALKGEVRRRLAVEFGLSSD